jgi:hypothetical protein
MGTSGAQDRYVNLRLGVIWMTDRAARYMKGLLEFLRHGWLARRVVYAQTAWKTAVGWTFFEHFPPLFTLTDEPPEYDMYV